MGDDGEMEGGRVGVNELILGYMLDVGMEFCWGECGCAEKPAVEFSGAFVEV